MEIGYAENGFNYVNAEDGRVPTIIYYYANSGRVIKKETVPRVYRTRRRSRNPKSLSYIYDNRER